MWGFLSFFLFFYEKGEGHPETVPPPDTYNGKYLCGAFLNREECLLVLVIYGNSFFIIIAYIREIELSQRFSLQITSTLHLIRYFSLIVSAAYWVHFTHLPSSNCFFRYSPLK